MNKWNQSLPHNHDFRCIMHNTAITCDHRRIIMRWYAVDSPCVELGAPRRPANIYRALKIQNSNSFLLPLSYYCHVSLKINSYLDTIVTLVHHSVPPVRPAPGLVFCCFHGRLGSAAAETWMPSRSTVWQQARAAEACCGCWDRSGPGKKTWKKGLAI